MTRTRLFAAAAVGALSLAALAVPASADPYWKHGRPHYRYYDRPAVIIATPPPPVYYRPYYAPPAYYYPPPPPPPPPRYRPGFSFYFSG